MPPGKQSAAEGKRCQVSISYSIKTNSTGSPPRQGNLSKDLADTAWRRLNAIRKEALSAAGIEGAKPVDPAAFNRAIADGMRRFSTQYGIEVTGAQRDIFGVVAVAVEEGVRSEIGIIENLPQVDVSQIEASQAVTISWGQRAEIFQLGHCILHAKCGSKCVCEYTDCQSRKDDDDGFLQSDFVRDDSFAHDCLLGARCGFWNRRGGRTGFGATVHPDFHEADNGTMPGTRRSRRPETSLSVNALKREPSRRSHQRQAASRRHGRGGKPRKSNSE